VNIDVVVVSGIRPPVRNAAGSVERLRGACQRLGIDIRAYPDRLGGVSEDFGWYLDQADGALFLLGCDTTGNHPDLHTPQFDLDERTILTAVEIFHALAVESRR
jgi:metal-dependent amidase/aminoacylase/carboxypeptidase family protein